MQYRSPASGTPWLEHFPIDQPGPVIMFAGEGGEGSILRRIDAIAASRDLDADQLPILVCSRAPHLNNAIHLAELTRKVEAVRPVLVGLDPFYLSAQSAKMTDLYEMGRLLEVPQRICQAVAAALVVVHHYNRSRDTRGPARFAGAGPAEWGRVLIGASIVSRHTDKETSESHVTTELEVIGGEVVDQTFRVHRRIRADDPDDLDSPLHYNVSVTEGDGTAPALPTAPDAKPSTLRVHAVLAAAQLEKLTVKGIGDRLAEQGHPLKPRTIQNALQELHDQGLADGLVIDAHGTTEWTVRKPVAP